MREELLKLAERCEAATGTDVALNLSIAIAVGAVDARTTFSPRGGFGYVDRDQWAVSLVPYYTTSLDAAITLVPEGASWALWESGAYAVVVPASEEPDEESTQSASGAIPALALCAAALRARAALQETNDGE